MLLDIDLNVS